MRLIALLALVAGLLSACAPSIDAGETFPPSGARVDNGGDLNAYVARIERMREEGARYRVARRCSSACTMYLALPGACFPPDGVLRFHSVSGRLLGARVPVPDFIINRANRRMASFYPPRLRAWFLEEGPGATRSTEFVAITARELARRGELRLCRR